MEQNCKQCGQKFLIKEEDLLFYKKVSPVIGAEKVVLPPPKLCPYCRLLRRLSFRNERHLYLRKSDLSGKQLVSIYSPDKPYKVYELSALNGDDFDGVDDGIDLNNMKSFQQHFEELLKKSPHPHIKNFGMQENSDYCSYAYETKNGYLCFWGTHSEDCMFCSAYWKIKNCVDSDFLYHSEYCYEAVLSQYCYNSKYLERSHYISDSAFIFNSRNVKNSFFCANIENKEYCMFNEQLSKEDYLEKRKQYDLGNYMVVEELKKKFGEFIKQFPVKALSNRLSENVYGDEADSSKDLYNVIYAIESEKCSHSVDLVRCFDSYDIFASADLKACLECVSSLNCSQCAFCIDIEFCQNVFYSERLKNCKNCFGCYGLKNKEYCIFNKQYSKEAYEKLVPQIIKQMSVSGEWGEFFAPQIALFAYNEMLVFDFKPLTKAQALELGYKWKDIDVSSVYQGRDYNLPDTIEEVKQDITLGILKCRACTKNYKIIKPELDFYQRFSIPIPRKCPGCRYKERFNRRKKYFLIKRECCKCKKAIPSTLTQDVANLVICDACNLKEKS